MTGKKTAPTGKGTSHSNIEWENIFNAIGHPALILDPHHKIIAVNSTTLKLTGKPQSDILGKKCYELFHGNDAVNPPEGCPMEKMLTSNHLETTDMEMEAFGGFFLVSCTPVVDEQGNLDKIIHIATDITDRRKSENKLRENEIRFKAVFENSVDAIGVSKNGFHVFVNPSYLSLFGYTSDNELAGKPILDLIAPEEHEKIMENVKRRSKGDFVPSAYETLGLRKDGTKFNMDVHVSSYEQAGHIYTLVILRDITEHKRTEEILKESEERFHILLDQGFDGIFIHKNYVILDINQRMADILGYSVPELLYSSIIDRITPASQRLVQEYVQSSKGGHYEIELLRKNGRIVNVEACGASCKFQGRDARIVAIKDITDQKKLQEQLRQAQKMESIGHLAGGVAHDFNNILSAIVGYAHLTLMKLKEDDPLRMNIEHILNASDKAANLTQSLLAFSRKQLIVPKPVRINSIVFNMKKILDRIIGEDIDFKVIPAVNDLIIKVDKGQIEHALMNLATNARDAMPDGGSLTITTEEVDIDDKFIHMHQEGRIGKYAVITISDTGTGMDENTKGNIFEPFFTTKEVGKGTGLGLAMVYGTIKQHNGFINVYSEPGKGTTFKIYLPLAESGVQHKEKEEVTSVSSGNETVLLIEDDQAVRRSIKALLEEFGYKVIEAADGDQAITLFRKNKDFLQLVISDVIMPRQSGKEVYDELKKIRPDIKVLFISGYSADILTKKGIAGEGINFISKPIHPEIFFRKIREILDK